VRLGCPFVCLGALRGCGLAIRLFDGDHVRARGVAIRLFDGNHVRACGVGDLWRPAEIFIVFLQNRPIHHHACIAGENS
jgi:hypothetical protein